VGANLRQRIGPLAVSMLAAVALTIAAGPIASANHAHNGTYQPHLHDMHTWTANDGINDESFCVLILSGSTHAAALAAVRGALFGLAGPRWHLARKSDGTENTRVDIRVRANTCTSYGSARADIDFEFHIRTNNAVVPECGGDNVSCVVHDNWVRSQSGTHYDARWAYVNLDRDHLGSNHLINHEVGHVFGLRDGGANLGTGCSPPSIMHIPYYGCPNNNFAHPTNYDIDTVRSIINR
jgi:hypothetical protein